MSASENIRLAVCIPTYKRCRVVQDFLERAAKSYLDAGIDLYYYDSSPDDETERLVQSWAERFPNRIFYVRMPEELHSNMKVYKIFQLYGLQKNYDFIWVCNDAIRFTRAAVSLIVSSLDKQFDMIEVNARDVEQLGTRVYEDCNEYFRDCAWHLTLYGSALLNTETMLDGVDWAYYEQKYKKKELINYSHVSFYFTKMLTLDRFRALHISFNPREFSSSLYKKNPGWYLDTAFMFCEAWFSTVEALPECYTGKPEVIKKCGKYWSLENSGAFYSRKYDGAFSFEIFWKYRNKWSRVCDIPIWKLFLIAITPKFLCRLVLEKRHLEKKSAGKLFSFCKSNPDVYLFGTGWGGYGYGIFLNHSGVEYQGFCVTDTDENPKNFLEHPVCGVDSLNREKVGIVVSMDANKGAAVYGMLKELGFHHVFFDPDFFSIVCNKLYMD